MTIGSRAERAESAALKMEQKEAVGKADAAAAKSRAKEVKAEPTSGSKRTRDAASQSSVKSERVSKSFIK